MVLRIEFDAEVAAVALLGDRQEILHLPQLDLHPHLINVSEKEGVDYCFFEPTIASKAIIEKFL